MIGPERARLVNAYYGVSPQQSTASGLRPFDASAGLRAYGAGTFAKYKWSDQLSTMAYVEYERLSGEAQESPLLSTTPGVAHHGSPDQLTFGLGLSYSFTVGGAKSRIVIVVVVGVPIDGEAAIAPFVQVSTPLL